MLLAASPLGLPISFYSRRKKRLGITARARERERERCLIGKGLATEQLQVEVKDRWEKGGGGKVQARPWMHKVMPKFNLIDEKTGNRAISSLLKILQYVFTFFVL